MSLNLTLPPDLEAFVQEQASVLSEGDQSSYVLTVLREEKERRERRALCVALDEGMKGEDVIMDKQDWEEIRRKARARAGL